MPIPAGTAFNPVTIGSASYPGTVKVFGPKIDQVDVVYADHINALQREVAAIQSILGTNPQGPFASTVANRIFNSESGNVTTTGTQIISGNKTFTGQTVFTGTARAAAPGTLTSLTSVAHPFQVGDDAAANVAYDRARIQARNGAAPADLLLQPYGGDVYAGAGKLWTSANDGAASGLDADTVDGQHAGAFSTAGHKHVANFVQLTRNSVQNIPYGVWTTAVFTFPVVHYMESGTPMYTLSNGRFYTPASVGPALYFGSARCSFAQNRTGYRGIRFVSQNGTIIDETIEEADKSAHDFVGLTGLYFFPGDSDFYAVVKLYHTAKDSNGNEISLQVQANASQSPNNVTWGAIVRGLA